MQRSALCRSRRELSNAYLLAKIGVDTAEKEPLEVWGENSIQYSLHSLPFTAASRAVRDSLRQARTRADFWWTWIVSEFAKSRSAIISLLCCINLLNSALQKVHYWSTLLKFHEHAFKLNPDSVHQNLPNQRKAAAVKAALNDIPLSCRTA